jgi:hypothetical protein
VHRELVELGPHRALAGQEARAHAVRGGPEAEVETRRLELVVGDRLERDDLLAQHHRAQVLARHDAGRVEAVAVVAAVVGVGAADEIAAGGLWSRGHGRARV